MLAVERRSKIEDIITENKSVLVTELAKQFDVTPETIRGDLLKLEKQGVLVRTYGGATLAASSGSELSYKERDVVNAEAKHKIGARAADMIRDGETIFLDASTSSLWLARNIKNKKGLTVITNAVNIVLELAECDNIKLICTGGGLNTRNMSYTGRFAERMITENLTADKCFFSCKGVTVSRGMTDASEDEAEIKRAMMQASDSVIFLCDHNKLGRKGIPVIASIDKIDTLITDIRPDREWHAAMQEAGVRVITV
ncbi:MAG: DeoR/GlpR transcriptional regulator [Oscillospiraceae bacterium]|nr:DeoR/GlpR transcriptional regulator [Oscillospiraceae bacterium]